MAIFNLGSINVDCLYAVPHLPMPGETLAATAYSFGLGGKGANQSIAATMGGATVMHIGMVGSDGEWAKSALEDFGVSTDLIGEAEVPTGHAIINVDPSGENAIVIFSAANIAQEEGRIDQALTMAAEHDTFLCQNETNLTAYAAEKARGIGMRVVYSAAPFDADAVQEMLPFVDMLVVNEVEARQLGDALGVTPENLPVAQVLITLGADGAEFRSSGEVIRVPGFKVTPVDTTGAGDTFLGFFLAGLDVGLDIKGAMTFASAAAAIQVTRKGTAEAIPDLSEVKEFLEEHLGTKADAKHQEKTAAL